MRKPYDIKIAGASRLLLATLFVVVQIIIIVSLNVIIFDYAETVGIIIEACGVLFAAYLLNQDRNPSYNNIWIFVIMIFPFLGLALYLFWGRRRKFNRNEVELKKIRERLHPFKATSLNLTNITTPNQTRLTTLQFLNNLSFPTYANTDIFYYDSGEAQFEAMEQDIKAATHHVWLCYFILADGFLWDKYEQLLLQKAAEGLDVRLMFDDFGSIVKAPAEMITRLQKGNVKVVNFNPVLRYISRMYINYRNHQKIVIVDGHFGYTGGTNLADEYVNIHKRFGHWKDTAIRLEGDAVNALTEQFLSLWEFETKTGEPSYIQYLNQQTCQAQGFVTPYMDGPFGVKSKPAENMYRKMISIASNYLWIMTPYFIVDYSFMEQMITAAASGVDIRIITPYISDKKYVHVVTRSNYARLLKAGIRIYEYKPGFIHAKTVLSDDDHAITGTINFDFRSFNLHFENGVYLLQTPILETIKDDFIKTFAVSKEITFTSWQKRSRLSKISDGFFRIFSPFL